MIRATAAIGAVGALALLAACVDTDGPRAVVWPDPFARGLVNASLRGPLRVWSMGGPPRTEDWGLYSWPELAPVATMPTSVVSDGIYWYVELTPVEALEARWYALGHPGAPPEGTMLLGTPMADGGVVGRIFGVPVPEVVQIQAHEDGTIYVVFTHIVLPDAEHTETNIIAVRQGDSACETHFLGPPMMLGDHIRVNCMPRLDWSLPVEVEVRGAMSEDGRPVARVAVTHLFDDPNADGTRILSIESALIPPPVPTALCGGVDCE